MNRHVKRIEVEDVYVGLDQWDTEELIDELRHRALMNDQAARDFLFEPPAKDDGIVPYSTAAILSRADVPGIDLRRRGRLAADWRQGNRRSATSGR